MVFSSKKSQLLVAACLVGTLALPMMVSAQESDEDEGEGKEFPYRYGAHFVCGEPEKGSGGQYTFGKYATQVNMQDWHGKKVKLRKKVALTYPPRAEEQGMASEWIGPEELKPNHAMSVDCEEIVGSGKLGSEFFGTMPTLENGDEPTFYSGYVIIQSNRSLNVTSVHTAGPKPGKGEGEDKATSKDDGGSDAEGEGKQPQVHSISVMTVPEHIRAEAQGGGESDED